MVKKYKRMIFYTLVIFSSISLHYGSVSGIPRYFKNNNYKQQLVQNNIGNQKDQKRIVVIEKEKNYPKKFSDDNKRGNLNKINKYIYTKNNVQKDETTNGEIVKALQILKDKSKKGILVKNLDNETEMKKPPIRVKYAVHPKKEWLVSTSRFKNIRAKYLNKRKQKDSCLVNIKQTNEFNALTNEKKRYDNNDIQKEKITSLAYLRKVPHQRKKIVMNRDNNLDRLNLEDLSIIRSDSAANDCADKSCGVEFGKILRNIGVKDIELKHNVLEFDAYDSESESINNLKKELDYEYAKNNINKKTKTDDIIKTVIVTSGTTDLGGTKLFGGACRSKPTIKKLVENRHHMQRVNCQVNYYDDGPQQMIIDSKSRLKPEMPCNKKHSKEVVLYYTQEWFSQQYEHLQRQLGTKFDELIYNNIYGILFNKINVYKGLSYSQNKALNRIVLKVMNDRQDKSYLLGDIISYFLKNGTTEYGSVGLYNLFIDPNVMKKKDVQSLPTLWLRYRKTI